MKWLFLGIGKATALQFARNGARVIATDINAEALKSLEGIENISTKILDVTNKESINQLAKDLDKIDVLFNCAGWVFLLPSNQFLIFVGFYWFIESYLNFSEWTTFWMTYTIVYLLLCVSRKVKAVDFL